MEEKKLKTIGIIGGIGAVVTADFYKQLLEISQQSYHVEPDEDFPTVIIYNTSLYDLSDIDLTKAERVKARLIAAAKKLETMGADFIIIPSNTAHWFFNEMQAAVRVPMLNILEVAIAAARTHGYSKLGLLTSASTREFKLYQTGAVLHDSEIVLATDWQQFKINRIITHVKTGKHYPSDLIDIKDIIYHMAENGAEVVIFGSLELALVINAKESTTPLLSSGTALAEKALSYAYSFVEDFSMKT